jgi:hypothetical protein
MAEIERIEIDGVEYELAGPNGWWRLGDGELFFTREGQTLAEFLAEIEAEKQDPERVSL